MEVDCGMGGLNRGGDAGAAKHNLLAARANALYLAGQADNKAFNEHGDDILRDILGLSDEAIIDLKIQNAVT